MVKYSFQFLFVSYVASCRWHSWPFFISYIYIY